MSELSHTNEKGKANMVDVGSKPDQIRTAAAELGRLQRAVERVDGRRGH